ncbi:MAG TPA: LysO family transporter [Paludibacter sp.]
MFIVITCMLLGIAVGYLFRNRKIRFIHRIILTLIWLLLFLLGLEVGSNENVVRQFGTLGFEAFLLATAGTLGSVVFAWLLWLTVHNKTTNK